MMKLDLSNNVPLHPQQAWDFCGAACAQMTLEGNPDPARRITRSQDQLMNVIGPLNDNQPDGPQWATSPDGMKGCLQELSGPTEKWEARSAKSRKEALHFLVAEMEAHQFPTPVLIDEGAHWVLIVGWEVHGTLESDGHLSLKQIRYYDPFPDDVGSYTVLPGSSWNKRQWKRPVSPPGKWKDKYVAVGKPSR